MILNLVSLLLEAVAGIATGAIAKMQERRQQPPKDRGSSSS
ncbi:MAG: hypothetical protein V4737_10845 [Curtobacterium sp.]